MGCLDEPTLLAAAQGDLDREAQRAVDLHLDGCPACLQLYCHAIAAGVAPASDDRAAPPPEAPSDRYAIATEIGRGGMGRVYLARDRWLGRDVALKRASDPSAALAARFRREIALTARLEHPSIVPLHDAGVFPDGTPYYAMRLFGGTTLAHAIDRAAAVVDRLALLPHVAAAANAAAFAHRRGVVHRDIKPQNIIVGELGETMLIDWGLAKQLGEVSAHDAAPTEPVAAAGPGATGATALGQAVGTPGYTAPEQARAGPTAASADVYGLGATLFHLLTRRPPPAELDADAIDRAAEREGLSRDLGAIVRRALAPATADRYPTAQALAADLSRYLTGQLVEARRYSATERLIRWARRHRATVTVAACAALALALVASLAVRRVIEERAVAIAAQARAEDERDAAEGLIGFVVGDLQRQLERVGRLDLFAASGDQVAAYYRRVGADRAARPEALVRRSQALRVLGETALAAGDAARAEAQLRTSLALAERAAAAGGAGADHEVCRAQLRLATALLAEGKPDDADPLTAACADRAQARLAATPDDQGARTILGMARIQQARRARQRGRTDEAVRLADEAVRIGGLLLDAEVADPPIAAAANLVLAQSFREDRDYPRATAAARGCVAATERASELVPDALDRQVAVQQCKDELGNILTAQGDFAGAATAFAHAHAVIARVSEREPSNAEWRRTLSIAEDRLAKVALARGEPRRALEHYRAGRAIAAELLARSAGNPELRYDLSISDFTLGQLLENLGDDDEAERSYRQGLDAVRTAIAADPANRRLEFGLAAQLLAVTRFALVRRDRAWARDAGDEALRIGRRLLTAEDTASNRLNVAYALMFLAELEPAEARRRLEEAAAVAAPLRAAPADVDVANFLPELDRRLARERR